MVICNLSYLQQSTIQELKYQFCDVFDILELLKFYKYQNGYTQVFRWKAKMDTVLFSEFLRWLVKQMWFVLFSKLIDKQHWSMSSISDCQRKINFLINILSSEFIHFVASFYIWCSKEVVFLIANCETNSKLIRWTALSIHL